MAKSFKRSDRVQSEIQKVLAKIFTREINTKNLGMVSVSKVEISPDLAFCKVFLSFLDVGESSNFTPKEKIREIADQAPYIRHLLAKEVMLRIVPELTFFYDDSNDKLDHMNRLLQSVKSNEQ